ncbi:MAG: hypothetical protein IJY09_08035 [Lachnospiraceae bacterium]|nr:hypothetical protein [Lachnospiraceae bacterium]
MALTIAEILSHIPGAPSYSSMKTSKNTYYLMIEEIIITTIAPEGSPVLVAMTAADAVAYSMWQHSHGVESDNSMTKKMPRILCNWLPYGFYLRKNALGYTAYPNPAPSVNIATSQIHSAVQNYGLGMGLIKIAGDPRVADMPEAHLVRYIDTNENQKCDAKDIVLTENWEGYRAAGDGQDVTAYYN